MAQSDDVSLKFAGRFVSGWTQVRIAAGIVSCPRQFDLSMTERYPGEFDTLTVVPGDPCQIIIGADPVISGYVDRVMPSIAPNRHEIRVTGRGMCEDLVDCSTDYPQNQISSAPLLTIAKKLAEPFGVTVKGIGDMGEPIPQTNLLWGETPFQVITRLARSNGLLVYEDAAGDLILSAVGNATHASGFTEGENIQQAAAMFGVDQRYGVYRIRQQDMSTPSQDFETADVIETLPDEAMLKLKRADGSDRYRLHTIIVDTGDYISKDIGKRRGEWEAARRLGMSYGINVQVDSWRDKSGALWTPNQFAKVVAPHLKIKEANWVISDVTYMRGLSGTSALVALAPPQAFLPEPFLIMPLIPGAIDPTPLPPEKIPKQ